MTDEQINTAIVTIRHFTDVELGTPWQPIHVTNPIHQTKGE